MAFIPRRTQIILVLLIILILVIAYFRFLAPKSSAPPNPPISPTANPTPTFMAPSPTASVSAAPKTSPTPLPSNPKTSWLIYQNPFHQFTFEFPKEWQLQDFGSSYSPMATVVSSINQQPIGFTVSTPSWGSEAELSEATLIGPFTYQGWQGNRYQVNDSGISLTLVTATKSASLGKNFRINWVYPDKNGAIDTYLKPILNTFKFTAPPASPSAQPSIGE